MWNVRPGFVYVYSIEGELISLIFRLASARKMYRRVLRIFLLLCRSSISVLCVAWSILGVVRHSSFDYCSNKNFWNVFEVLF